MSVAASKTHRFSCTLAQLYLFSRENFTSMTYAFIRRNQVTLDECIITNHQKDNLYSIPLLGEHIYISRPNEDPSNMDLNPQLK